MKFKKRLLALALLCLTMLNLFSAPVMAAESAAYEAEGIMATSDMEGATRAGTIYRSGGSVSLGRVTLMGNTKFYVYLR